MESIIVTTLDIKEDYEIIGPVYYQISNKGIFSNELNKKVKEYQKLLMELKEKNLSSKQKMDWSFLYGEYSLGMQNNFDNAFFIAVEELKNRAKLMGGNAVIGMRQDIDLDTNNIQYFYLQIYGTAIKIKGKESFLINHEEEINNYEILSHMDTDKIREMYISSPDEKIKNACKEELIKRGY